MQQATVDKVEKKSVTEKKVLKLGLDLGTNTSVMVADLEGKEVEVKPDIVFSVVGYPRPNVLPGVLPGNKDRYFGEDALKNRLYLDLRWPLDKGLVADVEAAREFIRHLRSILDGAANYQIWCCVGAPARTEKDELRTMREAIGSVFDRFLVVPEPFLAALGIRDENKLNDPTYIDPVKFSMIVDVGAGTTDVCFLQGYYPKAEDQICITRAGNDIDLELRKLIENRYPDAKLHNVSITRLKEEHAYIGTPSGKIDLHLSIHGKQRTLDVTELVGRACEILAQPIVEAICELVKRCNPDLVDNILSNVIVTGGGSQIRGLPEAVEKKLHARELLTGRVRRAQDYKRLVAKGAIKVAKLARDDQWQMPTLT